MREMLIELDVDPTDRRWQERANCLGVDPDLFFPERGASTKEAKAVCGGCEVKSECLEYALRHGEKFGIWGGMSERERRRIRRQRALVRRGLAARLAPQTPGDRVAGQPAGPVADAGFDRRRRRRCRPTAGTRRSSGRGRGAGRVRRARPTRRRCARGGRARARRGTRPRSRCGRGRRGSSRPAAGPSDASMNPSARTPGSPPSCSRISRAMRRATATSRVTSSTLIATSGLRAPTAVAPSVGCGASGPKSGLRAPERVAANVREIAAVGVGVVVEEHRHARASRPTIPRTRAACVARLALLGLGAAERDERHDIERAEIRVHAVVVGDRDVVGDRVGELAGGRRPRRAARARRA